MRFFWFILIFVASCQTVFAQMSDDEYMEFLEKWKKENIYKDGDSQKPTARVNSAKEDVSVPVSPAEIYEPETLEDEYDFFASSLLYPSESSYLTRLKSSSPNGAKSNVNNETSLNFSALSAGEKIRAYKVRIFFDNKQSSRNDAKLAELKFKKLYDNVPTFISYQAPYFKVTVGVFLSKQEAVIMCGKIHNSFPTAFVVTEELPLSTFTKHIESPKKVVIEYDNIASDSIATIL